jgi:hypothetical protein
MKVNKEEWRQMMGLADADERGLRGVPSDRQAIIGRHKHKGNPKEDIEKAIWYLQRYLETLDDNA